MKAITYHAPADLRVERVPDPVLLAPTDALVRVRLAAICGSDLHVWHGRETGLDPGTVMGHEFVGEVLEVGGKVSRIHPGDRVASPFTTSCGDCFYCRNGLTARCVRGELFGWVERGQGLHGAQAELVRVPLADTTLFPLPAELSDETGLLLGDVLATGYHCARLGGAAGGTTVAVLGCGPVGLMAVLAARELGADPIFALDSVPERLAWAARLGAEAIDLARGDAILRIRERTGGRGPDAVLEAVGSGEANRLAFELVRPGGTVSVVGVHHEAGFPFTPGQAYDKNLTWRIGRCPARYYMEGLIPLALRRQPELRGLFTHTVELAVGPDAYRMFAERRDGCVKV
ncbi:MAG TPA: alcohol dehydrogenase family protein, partial [Gemmatimonadales bacterium]|nr:alcohol dehydrogenase family protein [Gemmatimonadales bacterium]